MISVIIPCYSTPYNNHGEYVKRATQSALNQIYKEVEIIIVDDGSPFPVTNIWGNPVRVIRHERNQGLSAALNTGIRASNSDRFIILASDDELRQDCLQKLSQNTADVVCSDFIGDVGGAIKCRPADLKTLVEVGNCHSYAALIRKSVWDKTGGYKIDMNPSWEDYEQFVNLAKHGATWDYVPEALHIYHRNPHGRDVEAQTKLRLLQGKLHGFHQDLYGKGAGLVTFVIPCYNQEQWLPEALQSIKAQTYPHVNVVVVDDGSPGNVLKAVQGFDVHVVRQHNKHLSGARNTGIHYALDNFNSQYLIMLDADDKVEPAYVEELMGELGDKQYIYTDIQFIGDAWHTYNVDDYDCKLLTKKHLHACTFLAPSQLWKDIIIKRGYAYDEAMKKGYEDWEFALAALQYGWCGKRYPKYIFQYRYHKGSSMRKEAADVNDELTAYVKSKHSWINNQESLRMACSTCGGRTVSMRQIVNKNGGTSLMINVAGIGQVDAREPLQVTFRGQPGTTYTKIGASGTIYKYSNTPGGTYPNTFTIFARDANLFVAGPFEVKRLQIPEAPLQAYHSIPVQVPAAAPVEKVDPLMAKFEQREATLRVTTLEPDDLTELRHVGKVGANQLTEAGFAYFADVADATSEEISIVLKVGKKTAAEIIEDAALKINAANYTNA